MPEDEKSAGTSLTPDDYTISETTATFSASHAAPSLSDLLFGNIGLRQIVDYRKELSADQRPGFVAFGLQ
jgi:hypothetical protein